MIREARARLLRLLTKTGPTGSGAALKQHRPGGTPRSWTGCLKKTARQPGKSSRGGCMRPLWIDASGLQDLVDLLDHVRSPEFREAMGDYGDSYT